MLTHNYCSRERPAGVPEFVTVRGVTLVTDWDGFHAIARGYCPISSTGFCSFGGCSSAAAATLEARSVEHDQVTADVLRRVRRAARLTPPDVHSTALGRFLTHSGAAVQAVEVGLFSTDARRAELWRFARRTLELILATPSLHPSPSGVWSPEVCHLKLVGIENLLRGLQAAMQGQVEALGNTEIFSAKTYLRLPARSTPEPVIEPLAGTEAFGFAADSATELGREPDSHPEDRDEPEGPASSEAPGRQLMLF